jgi:hypothetical protein
MQLKRADVSAQRGKLAMSQLRYRNAARHFAEPASRFAEAPPRAGAVRMGGDAVQSRHRAPGAGRAGEQHNASDRGGGGLSRGAGGIHARRGPSQWAATQNNLGLALERLDERESGTGHLEKAVAAFRAALEERTHDRIPLDWAQSTGNQGVALV